MKGYLYKTILLSLMVCNIKVAGQGCAQGEPKIGDTQPGLNITILPPTQIPVGTNMTIICDADKPRLSNSVNTSFTPLPPVLIRIYIGDNIVKTCKDVPALTCRYIVPNVTTTMPSRIYCRASNSEKGCRLKFVELEFINAIAYVVTTARPTRNSTTTNEGGNGVSQIQVIIVSSGSLITIVFGGIVYMIYIR